MKKMLILGALLGCAGISNTFAMDATEARPYAHKASGNTEEITLNSLELYVIRSINDTDTKKTVENRLLTGCGKELNDLKPRERFNKSEYPNCIDTVKDVKKIVHDYFQRIKQN